MILNVTNLANRNQSIGLATKLFSSGKKLQRVLLLDTLAT